MRPPPFPTPTPLFFPNSTCHSILENPDSMRRVTLLLKDVIAQPETADATLRLLEALLAHPSTHQATVDLVNRAMADPSFVKSTNDLAADVSHSAFENEAVFAHAKGFLSDVFGDREVQRSAGDALWNAAKFAVVPRGKTIVTEEGDDVAQTSANSTVEASASADEEEVGDAVDSQDSGANNDDGDDGSGDEPGR